MEFDKTALDAAIRELDRVLDWAMRAAVIDLATEPGQGDEPDASRFGLGTAEYLTAIGVLDDRGFVTDLGVAAGWAFQDADVEAAELDAAVLWAPLPELPANMDLIVVGAPEGAFRPAGAERVVLTPTELTVIGQIAAGASNAQIAQALVISAQTVQTYVGQIYEKTGARSRADLAAIAIDAEWP